MLLLDHVGAKSGTRRTSPLLYFKDGDDLVVVASKGGFPKHPAWYHNLMANPDTEVQVGSEHRRVHARVATAEERKRLWPVARQAVQRLRRLPGAQQGPRDPAGDPRAPLRTTPIGSAVLFRRASRPARPKSKKSSGPLSGWFRRRSSATGVPVSSAIASGGQGPAQLSRAPSIVIVVPEKKSPAGEAR